MSVEAESNEWNLGQDDPGDHYPWRWHPQVDDGDGGPTLGTISTPNGRRSDGTMHTAWSVVHNVWEPQGHLICRLVNEWAHQMYGTPLVGGDESSLVPMPVRPLRVEVYESTVFADDHWPEKVEYRWRVVHTSNGEVMASGEGYTAQGDRDHAVKVLFPGVEIVEVEG